MTNPTPLNAITEKAGATFVDTAEFRIPAHFGGPASEYTSVRNSAGLFDSSHAGKLRLTGPDAPMFLGNLSTNHIAKLPLGAGCETYFCDHRAKALFQGFVYHILLAKSEHALWLETTPGKNRELARHLDKYLISERVEIADATAEFAQMHLAGPKAKAILESALADELPDLQEFQHLERTFGSQSTCSMRRRDPLGEPGYDLVCLPERAEGIWRLLVAAGAKPAGAEAYETLRIEAGTPVAGIDFDENRFVMEIGDAARAVSYEKGCYLGQEPIVMSRDRGAGHAPRSFVGLKLNGELPPSGAKILFEGEEAGVVTSRCHSPKWNSNFALGYVRWKHREPGTALEVDGGGAAVVELPGR